VVRCWAAFRGDCSKHQSKEHYVSKGLFKDSITIKGLPWCKDDETTIGISSFTSKILCSKHNHELSEADKEAQNFKRAVKWLGGLKFLGHSDPLRRKDIDGLRLARWMAKTACGVAVASGGRPSELLETFAFSRTDDQRVGVYILAEAGDRLDLGSGHLRLRWLHDESDADAMSVAFLFFGMPLVISTLNTDAAESIIWEQLGLPAIERSRLRNRCPELQVDHNHPGLGPVRLGTVYINWPQAD